MCEHWITGDIFKHIFIDEICDFQWNVTNIWTLTLFQMKAWRQAGNKTITEPMVTYLIEAYMYGTPLSYLVAQRHFN